MLNRCWQISVCFLFVIFGGACLEAPSGIQNRSAPLCTVHLCSDLPDEVFSDARQWRILEDLEAHIPRIEKELEHDLIGPIWVAWQWPGDEHVAFFQDLGARPTITTSPDSLRIAGHELVHALVAQKWPISNWDLALKRKEDHAFLAEGLASYLESEEMLCEREVMKASEMTIEYALRNRLADASNVDYYDACQFVRSVDLHHGRQELIDLFRRVWMEKLLPWEAMQQKGWDPSQEIERMNLLNQKLGDE